MHDEVLHGSRLSEMQLLFHAQFVLFQAWVRKDEKSRVQAQERLEGQVSLLQSKLFAAQEQLQGLQYLVDEFQTEKEVMQLEAEELHSQLSMLQESLSQVNFSSSRCVQYTPHDTPHAPDSILCSCVLAASRTMERLRQ